MYTEGSSQAMFKIINKLDITFHRTYQNHVCETIKYTGQIGEQKKPQFMIDSKRKYSDAVDAFRLIAGLFICVVMFTHEAFFNPIYFRCYYFLSNGLC